MALNFPDPAAQTPVNTWSPTSTPSATTNGTTYTWDGEKWRVSGSPAFVNISGDTMTGNLTVPSLNEGQLAGLRNVLINGDFRIWQRGAVVTSSEFGPDRWRGAASAVISEWRERVNGNVPECPVAAEVTSSGGANDFIFQSIELPAPGNPGPFATGTTWTFSFWANVDMIPNWSMSHCLLFADGSIATTNQTFAVSGGNAPPVVVETSASDPNWKRYAIKNLVIDTAPAASNTLLAVRLKLPTTAVRLGQCQLEPGPVATPFEHRPYATELALSQRYYNKVSDGFFRGFEIADGSGTKQSVTYFPATMRATPTVTMSGGDAATVAWDHPYGFGANFTTPAGNGVAFNDYTADAEL